MSANPDRLGPASFPVCLLTSWPIEPLWPLLQFNLFAVDCTALALIKVCCCLVVNKRGGGERETHKLFRLVKGELLRGWAGGRGDNRDKQVKQVEQPSSEAAAWWGGGSAGKNLPVEAAATHSQDFPSAGKNTGFKIWLLGSLANVYLNYCGLLLLLLFLDRPTMSPKGCDRWSLMWILLFGAAALFSTGKTNQARQAEQ